MSWQEENPLAAAVGTATSFLQGRTDAVDKKRQQAGEDADRAQRQQAFAAEQAARAQQAAAEQQRLALDKQTAQQRAVEFRTTQRSKGYDDQGKTLPDPYQAPANHGVMPTLRQQSVQAFAHGLAVQKAGMGDVAKDWFEHATQLGKAADDAEKSAQEFQRIALERLKTEAQVHHWSEQDIERAQHDAATVAVAIKNGELRHEDAQDSIGARYAAISAANDRARTSHDDRRYGIDTAHRDRAATLNALTQYRSRTEQGRDDRFNVGAANAASRQKDGANPGKETGAYRTVSGNPALHNAKSKLALKNIKPGDPNYARLLQAAGFKQSEIDDDEDDDGE